MNRNTVKCPKCGHPNSINNNFTPPKSFDDLIMMIEYGCIEYEPCQKNCNRCIKCGSILNSN